MNIKEYCTGFQHLGIPTAQMDKSLAFYCSMGFTVAYETVNSGARVCFVQLGNMVVELYESNKCNKMSGAIDHIALNVKNVDEVFAFAKEEGFSIIDNDVRYLPFFKNGVRFFTIVGPNGEKVEFNQIVQD